MRVLVVNAGSSSLKLSVLLDDELVLSESLAPEADDDVGRTIEQAGTLDGVGHRIVHGGSDFVEPVLVDDAVMRRLRALVDLAPLHQPKSLRALDLVCRLRPDLPAVACFDTAFHARLPPAAATYALPPEWRKRWDLRRYGFHGLSHDYASRRAAELAGRPREELRIVTCHLGAGASLAAVAGGVSVDTTMGFTPLEGLVMATRSGSVDPGLVLWLEEHVGMPPSELASTLEHRSGLLGLAGTPTCAPSSRRRRRQRGRRARRRVYLHRLRGGDRRDGGGDGRARRARLHRRRRRALGADPRPRTPPGSGFLGVALDPEANDDRGARCRDRAAASSVRTFVIAAREDLQIAQDVRRVLTEVNR